MSSYSESLALAIAPPDVDGLAHSLSTLTLADPTDTTKLASLPFVNQRFAGYRGFYLPHHDTRVSELFNSVKGNVFEIPIAVTFQLYKIGRTITKLSLKKCELTEYRLRSILYLLPNLKVCKIRESRIEPHTLRALILCPQITEVNLTSTRGVNHSAIEDLVLRAPQITRLSLKHTEIQDREVALVCKNLHRLRRVNIGATRIGNLSLDALGFCPNLEHLNIAKAGIPKQVASQGIFRASDFTDERLLHFARMSVSIKTLNASGCRQFSKQVLNAFSHLCAATRAPSHAALAAKGACKEKEGLSHVFSDIFVNTQKSQFFSGVMCQAKGHLQLIHGSVLRLFDSLVSKDIALCLSGFTLNPEKMLDMYPIFSDIQMLSLENIQLGLHTLAELRHFKFLRLLRIKNCSGFQGKRLEHERLERLDLCNLDCTVKVLEQMVCPKLYHVYLENCPSFTETAITPFASKNSRIQFVML